MLAYSCFFALAVTIVLSKQFERTVLLLSLAVLIFPLGSHLLMTKKNPARTLASREGKTILYSKQSPYQKIVLTEEPADPLFYGPTQHVLYLDGFVQFSSQNEQGYHICIANIPATAAEYVGRPPRNALILGGGDGLVARNLLLIRTIKNSVQVELDPHMLNLAYKHPAVTRYNMKSLHADRLRLLVDDAFRWVQKNKTTV